MDQDLANAVKFWTCCLLVTTQSSAGGIAALAICTFHLRVCLNYKFWTEYRCMYVVVPSSL